MTFRYYLFSIRLSKIQQLENRVFSHILWAINLWNCSNGNLVILILSNNLFILDQAILLLRIYSTNVLEHVCMPWLFITDLFSYSKRFEPFPLEDWLNQFIYMMEQYVVVWKNQEALYMLILNTFIIYVQWKKIKYNTVHRICYLSVKVGRMRLLGSEFLTSAQWALERCREDW